MIKNQQRVQLANNLTQPFYGHSGLQNYDQRAILGQITESAERARAIKFGGAKESMNENFQAYEPERNMEENMVQLHLKEQVEKLKTKISDLTEERDKTIQQFEANEKVWKTKNTKSQNDLKGFLEMNQSLKDDNKDLMIQLDKYIKRVKQLENEVDREKEEVKRVELSLHDLKKDKQEMQDQVADYKAEVQKLSKKQVELQVS